MLQNYRI